MNDLFVGRDHTVVSSKDVEISVDSNHDGDGSVHGHYDAVIGGLSQAQPLILMDFASIKKVIILKVNSFS